MTEHEDMKKHDARRYEKNCPSCAEYEREVERKDAKITEAMAHMERTFTPSALSESRTYNALRAALSPEDTETQTDGGNDDT